MSKAFQTALIRGLIGAVLTAGAVFFAGMVQGQTAKVAGIAAGAAGFSYLVVRFGGEGVIDTRADSNGGPIPPAMA